MENVVIIGSRSVPVEGTPCTVCVLADPQFVRGDCNANGRVGFEDAIFLLEHLFLEGDGGDCREACNSDGFGIVTIADSIHLLGFTLSAGPPPPPPYPECGTVPNPDCGWFAGCP